MKIFSFGGGVQSTAVLVLQAQGVLNYDEFVFVNVGDDSENPATLEYIEKYSKPYAAAHGIKLVEIGSPRKDGKTLYQYVMDAKRGTGMVVYMSGGMPGNRDCTVQFKIKNIQRYMKRQGHRDYITGIGISLDEYQRMRDDPDKEYPLIDLRISRAECHRVILDAGLPTPPKSSCWFCPFQSLNAWRNMRQNNPDMFQRAVELERTLIERRAMLGKDACYLTRFGRPLDHVFGDQLSFTFPDTAEVCESGYCMV